MACGTSCGSKEELLNRHGVALQRIVRGRGVQRSDECRQRVQLRRGEIERRHAAFRNSCANGLPYLSCRTCAHGAGAGEFRRPIATVRIGSVAGLALFVVERLTARQTLGTRSGGDEKQNSEQIPHASICLATVPATSVRRK